MAMTAMAVPVAHLVAAMVPAMMMIAIAVAIVPVLRHRRHAEAGERDRGDRGQFEKRHTHSPFTSLPPAGLVIEAEPGEVHGLTRTGQTGHKADEERLNGP
jgi:hypothetical protein